MVAAFDAVLIALMHAIHAQVAGLIVGRRRAAFADGDHHRPRLGLGLAQAPIAVLTSQVIQMRHRDLGQALVTSIAKDVMSALHELLGGQTRQGAVQGISIGEQTHVSARVGAGKAGAGAAVALGERTTLGTPLNQPGKLLARIAADPRQEAQHHALVGSRQMWT